MKWNSFGDLLVNIFTLFGGAVGIFGAIVGVAQVSGKKWIDHWFEKKNKDYQEKIDTQLESHKAELTRTTNEIQEKLKVEYLSIYAKRLSAIETLYSQLIDMKYAEKELANQICRYQNSGVQKYGGTEYLTLLIDGLIQTISEMNNNFERWKIYFTGEDTEKIKLLLNKGAEFKKYYDFFIEAPEKDESGLIRPIEYFVLNSYNILFGAEYDKYLCEIEDRFRDLIGIK